MNETRGLVSLSMRSDHADMSNGSRRSNSTGVWSRATLMAGMIATAIGCASLAVFIDTTGWIEWFAHPAQSRPDLTRQGVELLRMMLWINAVMLVMAPVFWLRLSPIESTQTIAPVLRRERRWWWLIGILMAGLCVRAARINEGLWYDEIASWMTYNGGTDSFGAVIGNFLDPINHPCHTLLNALSVRWFSDVVGVDIAFRLPAFVFSLLSIVAMFGLARHALGDRAALIASFLVAVLPVSVLEGVEARGYSMMIFFSAMMTWMFVIARSRKRPWFWLAYAVVCTLGIWSHFVTAFVPIGHAIWILWRGFRFNEWREAASGAVALALGAAITITLYSPMIPTMLASRGMFSAINDTQPTILGPEGLHALLQLGGSWYWWAALPGLALVLIGLAPSPSAKRDGASGVIELTLIGLPLMLIIVALSGTWMYARFTFFAWPGAALLIALGIDRLWNRKQYFGVVACIIIALASVADLAIRQSKQPLRDAADFVRENRQPEDKLLVIGLAHPVLRLYANDLILTYSFRHGADLSLQLAHARPEWIIVEYPRSVSSETYSMISRAGYSQVQRFPGWVDWTNGDVIVYRRQ